MEDTEDFTPDFTHTAEGGEISNRGSIVKHIGGLTYISVNDRINVWNVRFSEVVRMVHGLRKKITSFDCEDDVLAVGYENGVVQIHSERVSSFRPHSRRVVRIIKRGDDLFSASADGSIILYNLVGEEIRVHYEGCSASVEDAVVACGSVFAVCADNSIRIWSVEDRHVRSVHVFEKAIKTIVVEDHILIVFFKDGDCIFYNLDERTTQHFNKFKKIRNVKGQGKQLFVQCRGKMHVYEVVVKEGIVLRNVSTETISDRYVDFDVLQPSEFVFAATDNCWEVVKDEKTYSFGYHRSEILDFGFIDGGIATVSQDCIVFWRLEEGVQKVGSVQIQNGECMSVWNGCVAVGGRDGVSCYSVLSHDLVRKIETGPVSCVSSDRHEMAVGSDNRLMFYNREYEQSRNMETEAPVASIGMSEGCSIFCVGLLNNKVYVHDAGTLALKVVLYGHSLPVRSMALSPDGLELLTCGADKVVKMWGTQFGECRKTFVGDARNVIYLSKSLFMFSSGTIQYFRRYDRLREFKNAESSLVRIRDDAMVSCGKFGMHMYKMDKYEFQEESSSEEEQEEVLRAAKVVNYRKYDKFLLGLEKVGEDFSELNIKSFFEVLMDIDFCELNGFLCLLTSLDVSHILNVLDACCDWNIILAARIFVSLTKLHKDICVSHPKFKCILKTITNKVAETRDQIGLNDAFLLTEKNAVLDDMDQELVSAI